MKKKLDFVVEKAGSSRSTRAKSSKDVNYFFFFFFFFVFYYYH
jgi:hypothetical protein